MITSIRISSVQEKVILTCEAQMGLCFPLVAGSHPERPPSPSAALSCPPSLLYSHCERGCPRSCEGNSSSCGDRPSEGCFCPAHHVMLEGSCVPEEACTQCVGEDGVRHQVGALGSRLPWGCCFGVSRMECSPVTEPCQLSQQGLTPKGGGHRETGQQYDTVAFESHLGSYLESIMY